MPPVGRNIRQAESTMLRDRQPGNFLIVQEDTSLIGCPQMHDRFG